jgi:hypothetical protein
MTSCGPRSTSRGIPTSQRSRKMARGRRRQTRSTSIEGPQRNSHVPLSSPFVPPPANVANRVRRVLAARNLTISQISKASRIRFPDDRRFFIPHNFYHDLGLGRFSPSMHQIFTLSILSDYRIVDWLSVFGFDLDEIPRLQAVSTTKCTVLLDSQVYDREKCISWFEEIDSDKSPAPVGPLSRWLVRGSSRRMSSLIRGDESLFLYAKIGTQDAFAYPDLLPGSIVRVDPRPIEHGLPHISESPSKSLFLVEHSKGLTCCRLSVSLRDRITLCSNNLPYAQVELQIGKEARILGIVDLEIRPLVHTAQPHVAPELARFWTPLALDSVPSTLSVGAFVRRARIRSGLSFRQASTKSRDIARALRDPQYFCAAGSLSDYEALKSLPRRLPKIVSLCVLYSMSVWEFVERCGLRRNDGGRETIPEHLLERPIPKRAQPPSLAQGSFLAHLVREFEEIPLFLRGTVIAMSEVPDLSLRDIFWMGGAMASAHPYLANVTFAILNRRKKRRSLAPGAPLWAQPIYLLLKRDGTYLCTGCTLQNGTIVIRPFSDGFSRPIQFRNRVDMEIVGQVVTLVRKVPRSG